MGRQALLIGGLALIAGGVAYYYLKQQEDGPTPPIVCSDNLNQSDCEANDCYWYDGSCHSTPQGTPACSTIGFNCYQNINGWQLCDYYHNLCRCDGSEWQPIQENSQLCLDDISYKKCGVNAENKIFCSDFMGHGSDECSGLTDGCNCSIGECPADQVCAWDNRCVRKVMADTFTKSCSGIEVKTPHGLEHWCNFQLEEPRIAQSLSGGSLYYKWAGLYDNLKYAIDLYYNGQWNRVIEGDHWNIGGTEGVINLSPIYFSTPQPFSYIAVGINSGVSNVHLKNWGLTFLW